VLRRSVAELTREWRASVRRSGEFDALLARGTPVNHRRHLTWLIVMLSVSVTLGRWLDAGLLG
jgi:hypothetical protein